MRRSLLRRSLLAVAMIALLPVPVVRAADVQTVVTLDPIAAQVYRGDVAQYSGDITDGAPGDVLLEWSSDGTTWNDIGPVPIGGSTHWGRSEFIGSQAPIGTRSIRAHYPGGEGFLEAFSEPRSQEVLIHQGSITLYGARNPHGSVILPSTYPVEVYGSGTAPTSIQRWMDGAWEHLDGPTAGPHTTTVGPLGEGDHKFRVHIETTELYLGADQEFTVSVSKGWSQPTWEGASTVQAHHELPARVGVTTQVGLPVTGEMSVKDIATDTVIATGNVGMDFTIAPMEIGTHQFLVSYSGNSDFVASSKTFTVTATADAVEASNVGRNYGTFYPVKDGYRDAVTISGNRLEPLSVVIRVYTPTGGIAGGTSIPIATGLYQFAWNGRTSTGAIRAEGKYKIVQTLRDSAGTTQSFTSYVYLSHKKAGHEDVLRHEAG